MSYCHPEAAAALASVWGLTPDAALRWLDCECQAVNNPTNPLNTLFYGRAAQTGQIGRFATYRSPSAAFTDGLAMVKALAPAYGYGALVATLGTGDTYRQCRAIELSSWAAGHYGATPTEPGCLTRGLAPAPGPAPTHPGIITIATQLWNEQTRKWVCSIRPGIRFTARGAIYVQGTGAAKVSCYPLESIDANPCLPGGWAGQGYFIPVAHVRLS